MANVPPMGNHVTQLALQGVQGSAGYAPVKDVIVAEIQDTNNDVLTYDMVRLRRAVMGAVPQGGPFNMGGQGRTVPRPVVNVHAWLAFEETVGGQLVPRMDTAIYRLDPVTRLNMENNQPALMDPHERARHAVEELSAVRLQLVTQQQLQHQAQQAQQQAEQDIQGLQARNSALEMQIAALLADYVAKITEHENILSVVLQDIGEDE